MSEFSSIARSLFWVTSAEEKPAAQNFDKLRIDRLIGMSPAEERLIKYLAEFYQTYHTSPSSVTVQKWAEGEKYPVLTKTADDACLESPYYAADFDAAFEREVASQAARKLRDVCLESLDISIGESKLPAKPKGIDAAVNHLLSSVRVPPPKDGTIPSGMKDAGPRLKALYEERKNNPGVARGIPTGYQFIDANTSGIRRKSLYLVAGFAGHLKTTWALNQIVNSAVIGGFNNVLFSSEMPKEDVMMTMASIHSMNPMWRSRAYHNPVSQFRLIPGRLSDEEAAFYFEVYDDLVSNKQYGSIRVWDAAEFHGFPSICQKAVQEQQKEGIDIMWTDYLTRLPVETPRGVSLTDAKNEVIVDAKRFAMAQNIAVASPFQVNREGFKKAKDNGGVLDATSLFMYNSAEKEADVITYIWYGPEERKMMAPKAGFIKNRWGGVTAEPIPLQIENESRRIFEAFAGMPSVAPLNSKDMVDLV